MNKTDELLVLELQSGRKEALAELVKRWHLLFCKKAFWILKDADLSKDIAQESWQTIMEKIDTLNDTGRFGPWALRIVYSKSLDKIRALKRERENRNVLANEQSPTIDENDDNESLKKHLLKAINGLPVQQQNVLRLFYVEDYSLNEISKILNISTGTVKSRLFHAREKIKLILKNKNYEN